MTINKHWLATSVAAMTALGVGFGAARFIAPPAAPVQTTRAEDNHSNAQAQGFVALSPADAAKVGVTVIGLERGGGAALKLPGRVGFAPGAEAGVDSPLAGHVTQVHVGPGDPVAAGAALITLRSPEGAGARAAVDAVAATADAALAAERRDRRLFEQGWIAQARLDITAAEARRAEAELRSARARLGVYGAPGADGRVVVRSPIAGVVAQVSARPGQFLHEEALQVATVADTRRIELIFEAPPAAAALLRVGDRLDSTLPGAEAISGVITAVAPVNDDGVAVVRARPDGAAPPAGSVVSARISTGRADGKLVVPVDAVQRLAGTPVVFVAEDDGFRARPVATGRTADGRIEILSGLAGDERIAGRGAFLLKAELAKGDAEHGH